MFSKKTLLCVDVLIAIGSAPAGALVTTQALAERLGISISHMESIMRRLREGGFVRSVRGPGGGYSMTRHPDQLSVWAVVSVLDAEDASTAPDAQPAGLTDPLERAMHTALCDYLCTRSIGEFVKTDQTWDLRAPTSRLAFGLGPKPQSLMPVAPNSVFQLSSFLQGAMA